MNAISRKTKNLIQGLLRSIGYEIRYCYQNPTITDYKIFSRWMDRHETRIIFDIGGNIGQSAIEFAQSFPKAIVHSFEPFPGSFTQLKLVAESSQGRIVAHPIACGSEEGQITVKADLGSTSERNSLIGNSIAQDQLSKIVLPVRRIDHLCDELGITKIDILKTDTEGFDGQVLTGCEPLLKSRRIKCIISEIGFMGDNYHSNFHEVYMLLTRHEYRLAAIYESFFTPDMRCDYANALFVCQIG